jgi:hypothetical protein
MGSADLVYRDMGGLQASVDIEPATSNIKKPDHVENISIKYHLRSLAHVFLPYT